jgi:CubicO group peptidase (beta-lactamase class C family)
VIQGITVAALGSQLAAALRDLPFAGAIRRIMKSITASPVQVYGRTGGILLLLLLSLLSAAPVAAQARQSQAADDLETFLDGLMAAHLQSYNIPGATLAVVQAGEVTLLKGYGYAHLETQEPVEPERTLFRPGSTAKLVTWTAVMQLVEQGKLDLHADVNEYLDFTIPATFAEPITLHHLLTHTPGFEDVGEGLFVLTAEEMVSLEQYLKEYLPARVYPPGQVSAYSNYGAALAGYIVERVSAEPFEAYVERHIFGPLGMERSTFRQPLPPELAADLAGGYNYSSGVYHAGGFEFISAHPAGAMSAPAGDMARFMLAHLDPGRLGDTRVLQEETVQAMHRRHFAPDPRLEGMAYGFMVATFNGRRVLHHGGDTFLFHTALYLVPEENVGFYVSYNGAGGIMAREQLFRAFMDRYYAVERIPTAPAESAAQQAAIYAGEYHLARASHTGIDKLLRLLQVGRVQVAPGDVLLFSMGGITEPFVEIEPGLFRHQNRDEQIAFHTDAQGQTWLLVGNAAPFTFFRPPWYATSGFVGLVLLAVILLFLFSIAGWLIAHLASRRLAPPSPRPARLARGLAVLFGLLLLLFMIGLVAIIGDIDPAYGVPRIFFGAPPLLSVLMVLPVLLALTAAAMVVAGALAWRERYWRLFGRIHYTLLGFMALVTIWLFWYWNLLLPSS